MLRRLPTEPSQTMVVFAVGRLALTCSALVAVAALGLPYGGRAAIVIAAVGLPWSLACLLLALRRPEAALSPLIAAGDLLALLVFELVVPEAYAATRFAALFLVAAHAHFQGERRGLAAALLGSAALVVASDLRGDLPISGDTLALYEITFTTSAVATAVVVGLLGTAESAGRLQARRLSRRTMQRESEMRRRLAEAIHDGPVQELIGLDMMLSSARKAAAEGRVDQAAALLDDAREVAERNITILRDGIVDLGPYAFDELSFATAVENCASVWKRRYGFEVALAIDDTALPPEMAGDLFRITQEAVANAGRHADAEVVSISLRSVRSAIELRVTDNGHGFDERRTLAPPKPGHLGLASMRERAELLDGSLELESSERGTRVVVRAPLPQRAL